MKIAQLIIDLAFLLDNSITYNKIKRFFKNLLENDDYKYKKYFDYFMIFLILSSVIIIIEEVKTPINKWLYYYDVYFVTGVFIIEYLLRMWIYNDSRKIIIEEFEESVFLSRPFDLKKVCKEIIKKKLEYIFSPLAIIDLLAIIPSYREVRILRIFVLFRVFKLLRYSQNITHFFQVLSSKKIELYTLLLLVAFVVLVSGISLYVFEEQKNPAISTLFDAFYWSLVTISTVGYGDITPQTAEGRSITLVIILVGVGLISFATSIIVSAFSEKLTEIKENRIINSIKRLDEFYIICGYTHMAKLFAKRLKKEGRGLLIVDLDKKVVDEALAEGFLAICEDATKKDTFRRINFEKVKAVMALTDSDMHNIYICLNIRSFSKDTFLVSRTIDVSSHKKLRLAGADYLISPYITAGFFATKIIEQPIAVEAINNIFTAKKNALCDQVEVVKDSFLDGVKVGDIDFEKYRLILLGIVKIDPNAKLEEFRYKFHFNPPEDFQLTSGDVLVIMGYSVSVAHFKSKVIESSLQHVRKKK
ncbi:ion transporter [Nitratiruptor tergarcus]|uniref:BK channel n=1 Tax=Nitratiruptor tergarcus DSM 16512 TaxID=1069081 RepID=A0A1W1WVK4_9BACT|nr:ion transporter [Nitratiruptor tergarcus]SMC09763.1 voltage-gated potassium channel [Nitratiruptor tergarcus DSM 16512]